MRFELTQRGVALTELMIVLPLLLFLITGIVDLGLALRSSQVIADAAKHGARQGALVSGSCQAIQDAAVQAANEYIQALDKNGQNSEWDVSAEPGDAASATDDPTKLSALPLAWMRVSVTRKPGKSPCLLCWGDTLFGAIRIPNISAATVFRMKQPCLKS